MSTLSISHSPKSHWRGKALSPDHRAKIQAGVAASWANRHLHSLGRQPAPPLTVPAPPVMVVCVVPDVPPAQMSDEQLSEAVIARSDNEPGVQRDMIEGALAFHIHCLGEEEGRAAWRRSMEDIARRGKE